MNNNRLVMFSSLFLLLFCFTALFSSVKNIDLSWNAKALDLVDDNGHVTQDMTEMYNKSYLNLWFMFPITIFLSIVFGFSMARELK